MRRASSPPRSAWGLTLFLVAACSGAQLDETNGEGGDDLGDGDASVGGSFVPGISGGASGVGGTWDPSTGGTTFGSGGQSATGGGPGTGGASVGGSGVGGNPNVGQEVTLILQESETGFCNFEGAIESEHAGFSGAGYANGNAGVGSGVEWSLNADGGAVDLNFRYASTAARPATLFVNDVEIETLAFAATGAWATWQDESVAVTLEPGNNVIRLEADAADGLVNLDSLSVSGLGLQAGNCPEPDPVENPDTGEIVGFATLNGGTTGGGTGQVVTATTYAQLKSYAESTTPYVIMIEGTLTNGSGGGQINVNSNKSLIGVGNNAYLSGIGLGISSKNNIIVQNLRISLVGMTTPTSLNDGDAISIQGTSKNIWIDHCELFAEDPSVQTNIDKYDGLIDIKGQTGFITISWNYLHDHHKGGIVGAADDDLYADRKITFHHNYYNKVRLRVPMYRGSTGHFFNNYVVGAQDATEIRASTCVRVERNYYEALNHSIYTPSDSPGSTQRIDNIEVSHSSRAYPSNCTADIPYDYASALTTTTADVKTVVPAFAGVGKI